MTYSTLSRPAALNRPPAASGDAAAAAKERYLRERVQTASPAELTAMLFDHCVGSLRAALRSQEAGDHLAAGPRLLKAQDIIMELRTTLNPEAGPLAGQLDALYTYAYGQLVKANVSRDLAATREVLEIVEPLQTAWREACCTLAA
jgi:flagellar secretion chaperone FliS